MEYGTVTILVILVGCLAGFYYLSRTLLTSWRQGSGGKESLDAQQSRISRDYETCFNKCMAREQWDPDKGNICDSMCRAKV